MHVMAFNLCGSESGYPARFKTVHIYQVMVTDEAHSFIADHDIIHLMTLGY